MVIKAALFDYDGVITKGVADDVTSKRLARNLGTDPERTGEWIRSIWSDFRTNKIAEAEVWEFIENRYGAPISRDQRDIWYLWEELTPLPNMLALADRLKERGLIVGIVSNIIPPTGAMIRKHGGYAGFDPVILSYEVGAAKPDREIFEIALQRLDGNINGPSDVVFLDDREPAVAAARELGMHGILVHDSDTAIAELDNLLKSQQA